MILDGLLQFSDNQVVTATVASTNAIDLITIGGRDIGVGEPLFIRTHVRSALVGAGAQIAVTVEGCALSDFSTGVVSDPLYTIPAVSPAGTVRVASLDPTMASMKFRFLQLKYTVSGGTLTAATLSSFINNSVQAFRAFADNSTISG